jgi:hypothetical protein
MLRVEMVSRNSSHRSTGHLAGRLLGVPATGLMRPLPIKRNVPSNRDLLLDSPPTPLISQHHLGGAVVENSLRFRHERIGVNGTPLFLASERLPPAHSPGSSWVRVPRLPNPHMLHGVSGATLPTKISEQIAKRVIPPKRLGDQSGTNHISSIWKDYSP